MRITTNPDDLDALRFRLVPSGVPLRDVRPGQRGLSWDEYLSVHWADMRAETARARTSEPQKFIPIATARDRYGWRSLPPGTRFLGNMG